MNQPSVFFSCVSPGLRQTSSAVILTRLGSTPVIQEIFGRRPPPGPALQTAKRWPPLYDATSDTDVNVESTHQAAEQAPQRKAWIRL